MRKRGKLWNLMVVGTFVLSALGCSDDDEPTGPGGLSAPGDVQVSMVGDDVRVTWSAVSGADSYTVQRSVDGGSFDQVASGLTGTEYLDTDVAVGSTYGYRVIAVAGSETSSASSAVSISVGLAIAEFSGTIGENQTRVLSEDTTYIMEGTVVVDSGGVLQIEAGTLILGDVEAQPTALIVRVGGQILAEGTADAPIVFTSSAPPGERRRGDWGGVVLNGRSLCNFPADQCIGEGNSGPYGGNQVDDDSGVLRYVRIEYAGFEVSFGNELNGLTLNGVGSGTELQYIQSHYGLDDGIEFFGGTADLKYAIVTGASDDSFDYSTGWQGRGQFWIAQQDPNDADNGFEVDGNEDDFDAEPFTNPTVYNITLIGKGSSGAGGESTNGLLLRRGTAGKIHNAIVMGFGTSQLDIDNSETVDRIGSGDFLLANSIFFSAGAGPAFSADDDGIDEQTIATDAAWANRATDPGLTAPFNRTAPDFRPTAGSAATQGFATPPSDGFFEPVDFVGGVAPNGAPWYEGWITLDQG